MQTVYDPRIVPYPPSATSSSMKAYKDHGLRTLVSRGEGLWFESGQKLVPGFFV